MYNLRLTSAPIHQPGPFSSHHKENQRLSTPNLSLMVCPHDTARDPDKWFMFAQYLTQKTGRSVVFNLAMDFPEFQTRMPAADVIYANPQHTLALMENHGFVPLCRPADLSDEAVIIAREDDAGASLEALASRPVLTVKSMLVTAVALEHCRREGVPVGEVHNAPTWLAVANKVLKGTFDYGILYRDFYHGMTRLSRRQFRALAQTQLGLVSHTFLVAPGRAELLESMRAAILGMALDAPRGRDVLERVGMARFTSVSEDDIEAFRQMRATCQNV